MSESRPRTKILTVLGTAATAALCTAFLGCPTAAAADVPLDLHAQCATQYPETSHAYAGRPVLIAPGNAYSWRCEQPSKLPGGGLLSSLFLDTDAFCANNHLGHALALDTDNPHSWVCRR